MKPPNKSKVKGRNQKRKSITHKDPKYKQNNN